MAATIRDISRITGLSLATISKYLNGGNVLPENRKKIEEAIGQLHYEVNEMARSLVTSRSRTVGVVVFDIANVFTATILRHLGEYLREAGYAAMICDSNNDLQIEEENVRFLLNKKVDGLIVMPVASDAGFLEPALGEEIPVVLMDRSLHDDRFDCVKTDNRGASAEAVRILVEHGHRKIGVIGADSVATGSERLAGCMDAFAQAGINVPDRYMKIDSHSIEHGYEGMRELLLQEDRPTAVFLGNFEIILGAVMALNESAWQCPDDISLIGFDDLLISNLSNPRLFLAVQPIREMAAEAVRILLERLAQDKTEKKAPCREEVFPAVIVPGESIRDMRVEDAAPERS